MALALAAAFLLAGCIPIPISYTPAAAVENAPVPVDDGKGVQLTIGPREFLDALSEEIARSDSRLVAADRLAVRDAMFPDGNWELSRLARAALPEGISAHADFVVVAGAVEEDFATWIPTYIVVAGKSRSALSAFVFDLGERSFSAGFRARSEAAYGGVGYVVMPMLMPDTHKAVMQGLASATAAAMLRAKAEGPIRFVVMSAEVPQFRVERPQESEQPQDTEAPP